MVKPPTSQDTYEAVPYIRKRLQSWVWCHTYVAVTEAAVAASTVRLIDECDFKLTTEPSIQSIRTKMKRYFAGEFVWIILVW